MTHESDPTARILDKQSLKELGLIYKDVYNRYNFPFYYCTVISFEVGNLGFKRQEGEFRLDKPIIELGYEGLEASHSWCVDGEGSIIDLTLSQFNNGLENPVSPGIKIIKPNDPLYERYTPATFSWGE